MREILLRSLTKYFRINYLRRESVIDSVQECTKYHRASYNDESNIFNARNVIIEKAIITPI